MKDVVITYCRPCGYEKRAKTAAAALQKKLGVAATLKAGTGGMFEVRVGDEIVAARTKSHFPDSEHIVQAVSKSLNRGEG
jgi:selenoprotein W-related protein